MNFVVCAQMKKIFTKANLLQFNYRNVILRQCGTAPGVQTSNGPTTSNRCIKQKNLHFPQVLSSNGTVLCNLFTTKHILASCNLHAGLNNVTFYRGYAKGKSKVGKDKTSKAKKGSAVKSKVQLSEEELQEVIDYSKMKSDMEGALKHLQHEYITQLSLRNTAGVFDSLEVDTPDGRLPLVQVAQIIQKNPNLVVVDVSAIPQYVTHVKAALTKSEMNLNPQQDGTTFFIPVPKVTREHREALATGAKGLADKTKEKIRHIQNNFLKAVNKVKDHHPSNFIHDVQEIITVDAKNFSLKADEMKSAKEKELLQK